MAAKKMFPPRAVENLLGDDYDEFKLGLSFRIEAVSSYLPLVSCF